jgi:hypothetical protein
MPTTWAAIRFRATYARWMRRALDVPEPAFRPRRVPVRRAA